MKNAVGVQLEFRALNHVEPVISRVHRLPRSSQQVRSDVALGVALGAIRSLSANDPNSEAVVKRVSYCASWPITQQHRGTILSNGLLGSQCSAVRRNGSQAAHGEERRIVLEIKFVAVRQRQENQMKNTQSIVLSVCLLTMAAAGSSAGQQPQEGATKDRLGSEPSPLPAYKVLYSFTGGADGGNPNLASTGAALLRDSEGNLYGTAYEGGLIDSNCPTGCGVVFKMDRSGKETVLHAFSGSPDGAFPGAGLIMDREGSLFGTTTGGGAEPLPGGTVFKVDRLGHETVLHSFGGSPDGNTPYSSLTRDLWGNLYGTTQSGGSFCLTSGGCGVVFKLDTRGKETILHSFSGLDGEYPRSNLTWDDWGNLYGTTGSGGSSNAGVIFKIDPSGNEKVVYNFSGGTDGGAPGGLTRDLYGNFYGTAAADGNQVCVFGGCGVVFKLDHADHYSVLHAFQGSDGSTPYGRLLLQGGNLYGTTFFGGNGADIFGGTIFRLDLTGNETVLYNFTLGSDGGNPYGGLIAGDQGILYGTTGYGGSGTAAACEAGCGVVFELQTALCGNGENPVSLARQSLPSYQQRPLSGNDRRSAWVAKP